MIATLYRGSVKDVKGPWGGGVAFDYTDAYSVFDWGRMPDLLPQKGAALATLTAALKPGVAYGFGVQRVMINGQLSYGHSGRLVGAQSVVRWFPDAGMAIAVTTNESRFDPTIILRDLLAIVSPQSIGGGHRPV